MIEQLLTNKTIKLNVVAANWQASIQEVGTLLEQQGWTNTAYTRAMIDAVKEIGPYIVIAPGVALAHARPEDGVKEAGLALVKLASPVAFGHSRNDPVSLVFGLAATRSDQHINIMTELATLLTNEMEALKSLNSVSEIADRIKRTVAMG